MSKDDESFDIGYCSRCGDEVDYEGHLLCSDCEAEVEAEDDYQDEDYDLDEDDEWLDPAVEDVDTGGLT